MGDDDENMLVDGAAETGTNYQEGQDLPQTNMGAKSLFTTPKPNGMMRDVIIVECTRMNISIT